MKNYKIQITLHSEEGDLYFSFFTFHFAFCIVHFTKIQYFIIFCKRKEENMLFSQKKTVTLQSQKKK